MCVLQLSSSVSMLADDPEALSVGYGSFDATILSTGGLSITCSLITILFTLTFLYINVSTAIASGFTFHLTDHDMLEETSEVHTLV